ncbi:hypothetical protein E4U25_003597 [Claviceps purpurea]|nr:hypothetical protein E4U25_003597 [Claviceps purpurea]
MRGYSILVALSVLCSLPLSVASANHAKNVKLCSVFDEQAPSDCLPVSDSFLGVEGEGQITEASPSVLENTFNALAVLQNTYFDAITGTWPKSIDWTGAVVQTIISGTLSSLTKSLDSVKPDLVWNEKEQLISSLFAHVTHYFSGQNVTVILDEAYDDVLWVVLGWLEAIKFTQLHSTLHYPKRAKQCLSVPMTLDAAIETMSWHGNHWTCTFADRARTFWDFATKGWDTRLCLGGMLWNPKLEPYKNAITNELWISASTSMYEHFPKDRVDKSWTMSKGLETQDPVYLSAAVTAYKWLQDINMTNPLGLYTDGFHMDKTKPDNLKCGIRDEMVYTYNQGVILTGLRGLFTITGSPSYLEDGHALVQNAIKATGWNLSKNTPVDDIKNPNNGQLPPWRGLGRYGILEDACDSDSVCSQDAQTFKGIFFHHLTAFCAPLEQSQLERHAKVNQNKASKVRAAHDKACIAYLGWVKHNVDAALATRDAAGRFGMWWGASIFHQLSAGPSSIAIMDAWTLNSTDYRNKGTPRNEIWGVRVTWQPNGVGSLTGQDHPKQVIRPDSSIRLGLPAVTRRHAGEERRLVGRALGKRADDVNDRGRGRTVETQVGGLALLRAYWELSRR